MKGAAVSGAGERGATLPRASVVIPGYNLAWRIGDTILSARHQTLQ